MDADVKSLRDTVHHIKREDDRRNNAYVKKFAQIKANRQELEGRIAALEGYVATLQDQVEELLAAAKKKGKK